jgi:hypothetical protein
MHYVMIYEIQLDHPYRPWITPGSPKILLLLRISGTIGLVEQFSHHLGLATLQHPFLLNSAIPG